MKVLLLFSFILIDSAILPAQDSTYVTIKAGNKVKDVLSPSDIFYYPQFTNGKVYFKIGAKTEAKMNYTRLVDQMLFVGPKGDTLALADENTIKFIAIGQDTFYYDDGFIRLIANNGIIKLAEKQIWVVADVRKMGTHNRSTNSVAITSLSNYSDETARAKSHDLIINEDILIRKEVQYYFGDTYGHFVPATKKKLMLLFPKEELKLESFLKENKINFDKKEDVEKIAQFIGRYH